MKSMNFLKLSVALFLSSQLWVACGSGSSGGGSGGSTTLTITGQVTIPQGASSISAPLRNLGVMTKTDVAANGYQVSLYKIKEDGNEEIVSGVSATTDSNGNYTLTGVPPAEVGTAASTDFYYEVRATDGTNEVRRAAAPTADSEANVSAETTLVAKALTDLVPEVAGEYVPPPSASSVGELNNAMSASITDMLGSIFGSTGGVGGYGGFTGGYIPIGTATADSQQQQAIMTGMATSGNNYEKWLIMQAAQSQTQQIAQDAAAHQAASSTHLANVWSSYVSGRFYPRATLAPLVTELTNGTTHTPTEIVAAYNANNGSEPDIEVATVVSSFAEALARIESAYTNRTELSGNDAVVLYTRGDLSSSTFSADTELITTQVITFIQHITSYEDDPENADIVGMIADLTNDSSLAEPLISDVKIYHDSSEPCSSQGKGRFVGEARLYLPIPVGEASVTISGGEFGNISLTNEGNKWVAPTDKCVSFGVERTYTITASFTAADSITQTATRNHPQISPPDVNFHNDTAVSGDYDSPSPITAKRPVFLWTSPDEALAAITNAPAGSSVKYTYEFAHIDKTDNPIAPLALCGAVNAGEKRLYNFDYFIPTVDCDVEACAALTGKTTSNIVCRIYIQTYLVDEYGGRLGTSAGDFTYFCFDVDGDGDCG